MSEKNNPLGNFEQAREKMEDMQKMQAQFVSKILSKSFELQQKQYALLNNIMQNQMEFGNTLFSGAMNIINDNVQSAEKKSVRKE